MKNNHVALREFIETVINLNNLRRDDQLAAEKERLGDKFQALAEALKLQAVAYPTTRDFNELKSHVEGELASRSGTSATVTTIYQVLTLLSLVSSSVFAYMLYAK